jgi:KTSC domain
MKLIKVNSSAINTIGYDRTELYIEFNHRRKYIYSLVPERIFQGLLNASSKGTYYNDNIKDVYSCREV